PRAAQRDGAAPFPGRAGPVHGPGAPGDPRRAGRPRRDVAGARVRAGQLELGDLAVRRDAADLAGLELREPDVAVRPRRERAGAAVGSRNLELRDFPVGCDAPDLAGREIGRASCRERVWEWAAAGGLKKREE